MRRDRAEVALANPHVSNTGLEKGLTYLNAIPNQDRRLEVVSSLIEHSGLLPTERARSVDLYFREDGECLARAHQLIANWSQSDPAGAASWLQDYAHVKGYEDHIGRLIEPWRFQDFDAAADFAQTLAPGKARDAAIHHLASLAQAVDPHAALDWWTDLSVPTKRLDALEASLIRIDETAAHPNDMANALDSLAISPNERISLAKRLGITETP